ncbi:hypothetical protein T492DRAFT_1080434 [Pavlovales sp. CCMP2436]|nr:hypothetical protein T492DRAFT_1080434 [Pavlovales sp. CCMP2436]|mmetsp:Transcript_6866/g.16522  ORF Transcript_6866/g.16522 Transcript_6866/m.16522 type:complete len:560 (-) Transcript_6866:127-1806(-)
MDPHKKKRYDRQLRMWGEHGQEALEQCKLCLLNGSATGTELLKNLVLPGVGSFTVVDGATVTARDLGNNFFLEEAHIGRPRAECVTALLQELNEHVRGSFVSENPGSLLRNNPGFLDEFNFIVATQLPEPTMRMLADACAERNLPLVVLRSYGLVGTVRVAVSEHTVVEAHPDNAPTDLRACAPFPELLAFVSERFGDLGKLTTAARKHVPYIVLLLHVLDLYRAAHGGVLPASYKEKQLVKQALGQLAEGWFGVGLAEDAMNFEEAKLAVNTAVAPPSVPSNTRAVLVEALARLSQQLPTGPCEASSSPIVSDLVVIKSRNFWILAAALARFVEKEGNGALPLVGTLPDMTADTSSYVDLASIYRAKAAADAALVHAHVQAISVMLGLAEDALPIAETRLFCKNAHFLKWTRYRSIAEELTPATARVAELGKLLDDASQAQGTSFYLLLRAADAFQSQYNRWPGTMDDDIESDVPLLKQCVGHVLAEYKQQSGGSLVIPDDLVFEMCRFGAGEIHPVASIVGGVASQEVIKLVTGQFEPLNNTYIYNGLNGTGVVAEL